MGIQSQHYRDVPAPINRSGNVSHMSNIAQARQPPSPSFPSGPPGAACWEILCTFSHLVATSLGIQHAPLAMRGRNKGLHTSWLQFLFDRWNRRVMGCQARLGLTSYW